MSRPGPPAAARARENLYLRLARQLQHNRLMARRVPLIASVGRSTARSPRAARPAALAAVACLGLAGCLYLGDLNQRPSIEIERVTETAVERGAMVELRALVNDPDSRDVVLAWRAYTCAATIEQCDEAPFAESSLVHFAPLIPLRTAGGQAVQHVRITLDAEDARGATARPAQRLDLDVGNAVPRLTDVQVIGKLAVVGHPVELRAGRSDADDDLASVPLTWKVFGPAGSLPPPLRPLPSADPSVEAQELIPDVAGAWLIEVTARDPVGATGMAQRALVVTVDKPPCLATLSPPAGPLLFDQARRFSALFVDDDLDPYPAQGGGAARFSWSVLAPSRGPARQLLSGAAGHAVDLDPSAFTLGETVELRVEIADRITRALPCPGGNASCSIDNDGCTQRQTWRLEVR